MSCCPGVPPEASIDTVVAPHVAETKESANIPVASANDVSETYEILRKCVEEGICRGSRIEIDVREGAEIIDRSRVTYAIAHSRTSLLGIVGSITERAISISPTWEEAFKFGSTDYKAGTRTDLGYFELSGKDILGVHTFR